MDQILKTEMSAFSPKLSECISFLKCTYTILPCIKIVCVTLPELAFGFYTETVTDLSLWHPEFLPNVLLQVIHLHSACNYLIVIF